MGRGGLAAGKFLPAASGRFRQTDVVGRDYITLTPCIPVTLAEALDTTATVTVTGQAPATGWSAPGTPFAEGGDLVLLHSGMNRGSRTTIGTTVTGLAQVEIDFRGEGQFRINNGSFADLPIPYPTPSTGGLIGLTPQHNGPHQFDDQEDSHGIQLRVPRSCRRQCQRCEFGLPNISRPKRMDRRTSKQHFPHPRKHRQPQSFQSFHGE